LRQNNNKIPLLCLLQNNEACARNPWLLHSILVLADGHPGNLRIQLTILDSLSTNDFFLK
jgi:hypothetical protein